MEGPLLLTADKQQSTVLCLGRGQQRRRGRHDRVFAGHAGCASGPASEAGRGGSGGGDQVNIQAPGQMLLPAENPRTWREGVRVHVLLHMLAPMRGEGWKRFNR